MARRGIWSDNRSAHSPGNAGLSDEAAGVSNDGAKSENADIAASAVTGKRRAPNAFLSPPTSGTLFDVLLHLTSHCSFNPQLFVQFLISRLLLYAPGTGFVDKPVFSNGRATDLGLSASLLQNLVITIADFFVTIFYPKTSSVYYVSELWRIVVEKPGCSHGQRTCDHPIMKPQIRTYFIFG